MGNAESMPGSLHGDDESAASRKLPKARSKRAPPIGLQRKGSSFLEEPVIHKMTERGEAKVTVGCKRDDNGREGPHDGSAGAKGSKLRYAVSEMQGWRAHMEDQAALNPKLHSNRQQKQLLRDHHLFAVFDGHGGDYASYFCGENFAPTLTAQNDWKAYLKLSGAASSKSVAGVSLLKSALTRTFLDLDAKLIEAQRRRRLSQLAQLETLVCSLGDSQEYDVFHPGTRDHQQVIDFAKQPPPSMPANVPLERSGSTGVVVLITPSHIICANAGDSRAVLSKRSQSSPHGEVLPLSFDHKPNNDVELTRVEEDGGFVRAGRVDGDLAVSRSFGDFGYKQTDRVQCAHRKLSKCDKVTVHPDIVVYTREPNRDEFVVLACDGIWDRLTNKDCVDLVHSLVHVEGETDPGLVCEEVIDTALELDSRDNMTVCAVFFPIAMMHRPAVKDGSGALSGVMMRRSRRERQWGDGSTPAKRAQARLEDRRKKNRELVAMQNAKKPKSQLRRQRQGGLQLAGSKDKADAPTVGHSKKHNTSNSIGRVRSGKSLRIHANPDEFHRQ